MIYDISDSQYTHEAPDIVNWNQLEPGDAVGTFMKVWISPVEVDGQTFLHPHEERIFYVASINANKKFRVYWSYGERNDIQSTRHNGYRLRDEQAARSLFPRLSNYEFMVH